MYSQAVNSRESLQPKTETNRRKGADTTKPNELKREFVRLRAEGLSYSAIADQLHIAKSTCQAWNTELASEIEQQTRAELQELYESYGMARAARIKKLGGTLSKIDQAVAATDFSEVDASTLMNYQLKYMGALKEEGSGIAQEPIVVKSVSPTGILNALNDLLARVRAGEITPEQAQRESGILSTMLKALEVTEVKDKLTELSQIIGSRQA